MSYSGILCSVFDSVTTTEYFRLECIDVKEVQLEEYVRVVVVAVDPTLEEYFRLEVDESGEVEEVVGIEIKCDWELEVIVGMEILESESDIEFDVVVGLEISHTFIDDYDELAEMDLE